MNKERWEIAKPAPKRFFEKFPEYSKATLQLLYNRGLRTEKEIDQFLNPDYERDSFDPFLMKGMDKAVKRIKKAIEKKERIVIYGDYDVDGVTSTAVLYKTLKFLKAKYLDYYIPDKNKEGYSLNKEAIKKLIGRKTNLVITVDCGITSIDEVRLANKKGIDVIITDHHIIPPKLPPALAILNPQQKTDRYPFCDLAGVGVAFKLAQGLLKKENNENEGFLKWMLDLVSLGTIADISPLISENRIFARYGLIVLRKTKNLGLRSLMTKAKINPVNLDTESINFQIAPRINAAGRMDHASASLKLLITESYSEAEKIADNLNALNIQRQKLIDQIIKEARDEIGVFDEENKALVLVSKKWPISVLGLVAGRLSDELNRPVFLIEEKKGESKGSSRSIANFNITQALTDCKSLLTKYGGHEGAAGFSLKTKDIDDFNKNITKIANRKIKKDDLSPKVEIEAELNLPEISWLFYEELDKFRPFGQCNSEPVFLLKEMEIIEMRGVGNDEKHLKLHFRNEQKMIKAIGFNLGNLLAEIKNKKKIDIICSMQVNYWNGSRDLELKIFDLK